MNRIRKTTHSVARGEIMTEPGGGAWQGVTADQSEMARKLGSVGWALVFIWIGIAFLASISATVSLLVIGAITLGVQAARKSLGLLLEGFWIVVGLLFLAGGVWGLLGTDLPLLPILLVVAGVAILVSLFRK
jgi:hypothetical protein